MVLLSLSAALQAETISCGMVWLIIYDINQVLLIGIDIGVVVYILTAAVFYIERGLESEIRSGWLCPGS